MDTIRDAVKNQNWEGALSQMSLIKEQVSGSLDLKLFKVECLIGTKSFTEARKEAE